MSENERASRHVGAPRIGVSFEFFPPKTEEMERTLWESIERLAPLRPNFVSVTYGAGGSTRDRTVELTHWIKQDLGIEAMAHLSCVGTTRDLAACLVELPHAGKIRTGLAQRHESERIQKPSQKPSDHGRDQNSGQIAGNGPV